MGVECDPEPGELAADIGHVEEIRLNSELAARPMSTRPIHTRSRRALPGEPACRRGTQIFTERLPELLTFSLRTSAP
jgi:hypothetical protein